MYSETTFTVETPNTSHILTTLPLCRVQMGPRLPSRDCKELLKCFEVIRFTDKYDVIEAATAVEKCLEPLPNRHDVSWIVENVGEDELQFVLKVLHPENRIMKVFGGYFHRKLSSGGAYYKPHDPNKPAILSLAQKNYNLAAAMMCQLYAGPTYCNLSGSKEVEYRMIKDLGGTV